MTKKTKSPKKEINSKKLKIDSELVKKISESISQEKEIKKSEKKSDEEETDFEEETQETEFFSAPQNERKTKIKNPTLEESFAVQGSPREENLEENLAGVETPRKEEKDSKEFYSTISYGTKQDGVDHKYGGQIQQGGIAQRKEDMGPITAGDIRRNHFTTNGISPDVKKEIAEYKSHSPEEKYSVQNLERMDPTDLNRERNKNPFLQDAERVEMKYE